MKNKYIFIITSIILLNTSCTGFIGYRYKDYTTRDNIIIPIIPDYDEVAQSRTEEIKKQITNDRAWDNLIKVPLAPKKIIYKYGRKYKLVETERTYRFYKDRDSLYRYVDAYDDTYESDIDLGYVIFKNGRVMTLELFKDINTGKFYLIERY